MKSLKIMKVTTLKTALATIVGLIVLSVPMLTFAAAQISLSGPNPPTSISIFEGGSYTELEGFVSDDDYFSASWSNVTQAPNVSAVSAAVSVASAGDTVTITYTYVNPNNSSITATAVRTITIVAAAGTNQPPIISVQDPISVPEGAAYTPLTNAICSDPEDGQLPTSAMTVSGTTITASTPPGSYIFTLTCTDLDGLSVAKNTTVIVMALPSGPGSLPSGGVDTCTSAGGTCEDSCGTGQMSTSDTCPDSFDICCRVLPPDARNNDVGIVPCGANPVGGECNICHVQDLGMRIVSFLVLMVVVVAALLFVNAGILYVFSPTNPGSIARAHKIFTNTLIGLIIVLAAYMVIDVVMKTFVVGSGGEEGSVLEWGPWNDMLDCDKVVATTPIENTTLPTLIAPPLPPIGVCTTCTDLAASVPAKTPAEGGCLNPPTGVCQVAPELGTKLTSLAAALPVAGIDWQVTEAWPPTVTHVSPCHLAGTCVDANFTGGTVPTTETVVNFISAAESADLRAVYEVQTVEERDTLIASSPLLTSTNVILVPTINAAHFSVYDDTAMGI